MTAARAKFLAAGHYGFVSTAVARTAVRLCADNGRGARLAVDVGAGTGYYLAAVLEGSPNLVGVALDVSKPALRKAARVHPRATAALCDTWHELPLVNGAARLVLNVFAPRNGAEFRRVMAPDGALIVVIPTAGHLAELVDALGLLSVDPHKNQSVRATLDPWFDQIAEQAYEQSLRLTHAEVESLAAMGPSAWHMDQAKLAAGIATLPEAVTVTASVRIAAYRPAPNR
jgi:23S rRNA (guanine745-N1)-methyltransferase